MLTDADKVKIRLEEQYRIEVRAQLESTAKAKSRNRLWAFLNSSFGLWLLSAVFITGIGATVTRYRAEQAAAKHHKELIERLDLEISYRLSQVLIRLYELTDRTKDPRLAVNRSTDDVSRVVALLSEPRGDRFPSLYADFASMGLPALMADLRRYLGGKQRQSVDHAIVAIASGGFADATELKDVKALAAQIIASIIQERSEWSNTWFPYVDCPANAPFC